MIFMKIRIVLIFLLLIPLLSACKPGENPLQKFLSQLHDPSISEDAYQYVELDLKGGVTIKGRLVQEKADHYVIEFKGKEVHFTKSNVASFRLIESDTGSKPLSDKDPSSASETVPPAIAPVAESKSPDIPTVVADPEIPSESPQIVHLYLKTGDVISGILVQETLEQYLINYHGGTIGFNLDEIEKVVHSSAQDSIENSEPLEQGRPEEPNEPTGQATIHLTYGGTIRGTILRKVGRKYTVEWEGDEIELLEDDIESMDFIEDRPLQEDPISQGAHHVRLRLADDTVVSGDLVRENDQTYFLIWEDQSLEVQKKFVEEASDLGEIVPENMVVIYLNNGGAISGMIVKETEDTVTVQWQGTETVFDMAEVDHIERAKVLDTSDGTLAPEIADATWSYSHDVVVKLINGEIFDVDITDITKDVIVFRQSFEEGGYIEQEIARNKLETLLFKPVINERSTNIENSLRALFPAMRFYRNGNTTIVTDSYITMVKQYKRVIQRTQTEIYCSFFQAFKGRAQEVQNFVVIFDSADKWIEFTLSDGVPGWIVPGYFQPTNKILYLYNWIGDEVEQFINSLMEDGFGSQIDSSASTIKDRVDSSYHRSIDEQAHGIKNKFRAYFDWHMNMLKRLTFTVLRHEFAHGTFSNWGLQMVIVSKFQEDSISALEEKKKFLETDDMEEKKRMIMEIMTQQSDAVLPEIEAANSWFTEGVATYCETDPFGYENDERIYGFQEMMREGSFLPLEQLSAYKIGSFPGVYPKAMIYAYAQSWALVTFLMDTYRDGFISYMNRVAKTQPEGDQDILWLEEAIGKDRRTIERELIVYMERFPPKDDPVTQMLEHNQKFINDLNTFGARKI
jgi:hypothetical protein